MATKKNELSQIFEDMKLDEAIFTPVVMDKIKLIIESKVSEQVETEKEKLEEANKIELSEFKDGLITQIDEYMSYFVEEFTKENEKDIISSVKIKTAEKVLENFNKIVNDFNISLSEDTIDQTEKISGLEAELNESINNTITLKKDIAESNKYALILNRVMKIDIDSQKSKFSKIAESFEYTSDDEFSAKLDTLQETLEINESGDTDTDVLLEQDAGNSKTVIVQPASSSNSKSKYLNVLRNSAS